MFLFTSRVTHIYLIPFTNVIQGACLSNYAIPSNVQLILGVLLEHVKILIQSYCRHAQLLLANFAILSNRICKEHNQGLVFRLGDFGYAKVTCLLLQNLLYNDYIMIFLPVSFSER